MGIAIAIPVYLYRVICSNSLPAKTLFLLSSPPLIDPILLLKYSRVDSHSQPEDSAVQSHWVDQEH